MNNECLIGLTGDVMIGRFVNEYLEQVPPATLWGDLVPEFRKHDFNLMNLETTLTTHSKKVPKVFNFKSHPSHVKCLREIFCDIVNLANNHILDYEEQGLLDTLKTLERSEIAHIGAGRNIKEAKAPVIIERNGIRIGCIGCTDNEPAWKATETSGGTYYMPLTRDSAKELAEEIKLLKSEVDIVILSIHWGPNMVEEPPEHFVDFAHSMVDAGVNIFHGHSAHIFQGVEVYNGSIIFYDTGNFIDDYQVDPLLRNDQSFLFRVLVDKTGVRSIELLPTLIEHFQVKKSTGRNIQETLERMVYLSKVFGTEFDIRPSSLFISV